MCGECSCCVDYCWLSRWLGSLSECLPLNCAQVSHILIVVAYMDGTKADTHLLGPQDCLFYWEKWLEHLNNFKTAYAHDFYN